MCRQGPKNTIQIFQKIRKIYHIQVYQCERIYRVSIKSFLDYIHLLHENYVEYKHIFYHYLSQLGNIPRTHFCQRLIRPQGHTERNEYQEYFLGGGGGVVGAQGSKPCYIQVRTDWNAGCLVLLEPSGPLPACTGFIFSLPSHLVFLHPKNKSEAQSKPCLVPHKHQLLAVVICDMKRPAGKTGSPAQASYFLPRFRNVVNVLPTE